MTARPLAIAAVAALSAAAAALALRPVPALEFRNEARGRTVVVPVPGGGPFSITYQHSMYDAPVTEEFVVGDGGELVLEAVSSPSAAVREYFGLTAAGERHAVVRSMRRIVFRIAAGAPQRLRVGDAERSFLELGAHGDRLVLTAVRTAFFTGGLSALWRRAPPSPPLARDLTSRRSRAHLWGPPGGPGQPHPAAPALARP